MSRIEAGLHAHHASVRDVAPIPASSSSQVASTTSGNSSTDSSLIETPFAKVNSVVAGSPADDAGLRAGDGIRRFGNVNWINHEKLSKVAEAVQRNEGVSCLRPGPPCLDDLTNLGRETLLSRLPGKMQQMTQLKSFSYNLLRGVIGVVVAC